MYAVAISAHDGRRQKLLDDVDRLAVLAVHLLQQTGFFEPFNAGGSVFAKQMNRLGMGEPPTILVGQVEQLLFLPGLFLLVIRPTTVNPHGSIEQRGQLDAAALLFFVEKLLKQVNDFVLAAHTTRQSAVGQAVQRGLRLATGYRQFARDQRAGQHSPVFPGQVQDVALQRAGHTLFGHDALRHSQEVGTARLRSAHHGASYLFGANRFHRTAGCVENRFNDVFRSQTLWLVEQGGDPPSDRIPVVFAERGRFPWSVGRTGGELIVGGPNMPACPSCGADVREGKTFCGSCGASMTTSISNGVGGSSKIELDSRLLNSLLSVFVNKPGGMQVQVAEGHLQVQQGELNVGVEPFQLNQGIRLQLRNGNMGPFNVQVSQLQLGPQGLTISIQLQ